MILHASNRSNGGRGAALTLKTLQAKSQYADLGQKRGARLPSSHRHIVAARDKQCELGVGISKDAHERSPVCGPIKEASVCGKCTGTSGTATCRSRDSLLDKEEEYDESPVSGPVPKLDM